MKKSIIFFEFRATFDKAKFAAMIDANILHGLTSDYFGLYEATNRAQFARVAADVFKLKVDTSLEKSSFSDVSKDDPANGYALPYIEAAKDNGIAAGYEDGTYRPDKTLTKEELATLLVKGLGFKDEAEAATGSDPSVSDWAQGYVKVAVEKGIMNNDTNGMFNGQQLVNRYMLVTSTYSVFEKNYQQIVIEGAKVTVNSDDTATVTGTAKNATTVKVTVGDTTKEVQVKEDGTFSYITDKLPTGDTTISLVAYNGENKSAQVDLVAKIEEFAVLGVNEINSNFVDVTIKAPTEDVLGATIVVIDNKGNTVEVKPTDISAGDTTATFEFVNKVGTFEGVWTIGGISYDFDEIAKIKEVYNADNQVKLLSALKNLGIANVKTDNIAEYQTSLNALKTEVSEEQLTKAMVQELVNKVNVDAMDAAEEAAIVKSVTEAKTEVALLSALQNDAFVRVNPDWISEYKSKIDTLKLNNNEIKTIKEIQEALNNVNDAALEKTYNDVQNNVDKAKLTAAKGSIEKYATVNDKGVMADKAKDALKKINIQLAIVDVREATTPTNLKAKLNTLAALVNSTDKLDMREYVDANGKAYIAEIKTQDVKTVASIKKVIKQVNENSEKALLDTVKNANSADALLKALKAYPGLKQVADSNRMHTGRKTLKL